MGQVAMENTRWLPLIDGRRCTNCGRCVEICPTQALGLVDGKAALARPEQCDYCGQCELVCPESAIVLPYEIVVLDSAALPRVSESGAHAH